MEGNLLYAVSLILFCLYFKSSLELILFILALAFYFNVETFIPNPSEGPKAKGLRENTLFQDTQMCFFEVIHLNPSPPISSTEFVFFPVNI